MSIKESLRDFGLGEKEITVYLTILKSGSISPAEIARTTKIKRPSVYVAIEGLISKNIITKELKSKTLKVIPLPPDNLNSLLRREKDILVEKESALSNLIKEVKEINASKTYPVPKLNFIEKDKLDDFLFSNTEKWFKSCKEEKICYGFQDSAFAKQKKKWIDWAIKESEQKGYRALLISNDNSIEKSLKHKDTIRKVFFSKQTNFTSTTWVVGDYIIMISLKGEQEYLVEIYDSEMAHNMREMFKEVLSNQKVS